MQYVYVLVGLAGFALTLLLLPLVLIIEALLGVDESMESP